MGFIHSHNINEEDSQENIFKEVERDGIVLSQRISIHEIFESKELERLILACSDKGIEQTFFSNSTDNFYSLINESNEEEINLNGVGDFLEKVRLSGRKGLQIQRYKGLGK